MKRTVMHIDINSCFASCEQQDNPLWRGKPLGVVQDSGKRNVIIGSSVKAKKLGIGTGHAVWEAKKVCPDIILVPANFERYAHYSRLFRKVCQNYSDRVEVFSIDELFMDLTETGDLFGGAKTVSLRLKKRLKEEVGDWLRCSVGIAPNKMLAKLASGSQKPDGLVKVTYDKRLEFLDRFELWHICGIGQRIQRRLKSMGVFTIPQMRQIPREFLVREFGVLGEVYADWAWGEDRSLVAKAWEIDADKSYGNQMTLPNDTKSEKETMEIILWLCWQVASRLRRRKVGARTVWLALRQDKQWGHAQQSTGTCTTAYDLYRTCRYIYKRKITWKDSVRFVGVSATNLTPLPATTLPAFLMEQKQAKIASAWDKIMEKYGAFYLRPASLLNKNLKQTNLNGFTKKF